MMKTYSMPFGETIGYSHPHPERTARKQRSLFSDVIFQVWPNRKSMAKTIRLQQLREPAPDDWRPLVKLSDLE